MQVKEGSLANREGAGGSLPDPKLEPGPVMWSGCCVPSLAGPTNTGPTAQGTHHRRLGELLGPLQGGAGWVSAPSATMGGVLCEVEAAREGKAAVCW